MTAGQRAKELLRSGNYEHVIFGYRVSGKDYITDWETEMHKFRDDLTFCEYTDKLQIKFPNLEMIYAVHA